MWRAAFLFMVVIGALVAVLAGVAGVGLWQAARLHAGVDPAPAAPTTPASPTNPVGPATMPLSPPDLDTAATRPAAGAVAPPVARVKPAVPAGQRGPDGDRAAAPVVPGPAGPDPARARPIVLAAKDATLVGDGVRLEGRGAEQVATNWRGPGDGLEWSVEVPQGGLYEVQVEYACHPQEGGGIVSVGAGRSRIAVPVRPTAGWDDFQTTRLGILSLRAGGNTVLARATWVAPDRQMMNLRSVRLTLVRAVDDAPDPEPPPRVRRRVF